MSENCENNPSQDAAFKWLILFDKRSKIQIYIPFTIQQDKDKQILSTKR